MKTIHVVAAVIREGDRIFATQRGYGDWKDYWEFPGGKTEPGETPEEALRREIREELDTEIDVGERLTTIEYDYPDFHLSMECFTARVIEGSLVLKEHEAARWLRGDELDSVRWLPADRALIELLAQSGAAGREILAVSFGTTYAATRERTIGAIEERLAAAFPDYAVRRSFTSSVIRSILAKRDRLPVDSPEEALQRAREEGVRELIVQPTHLMDGREYGKLKALLPAWTPHFDRICLGRPLLSDHGDLETVAAAVLSHLPVREEGTAVVLMGHGTDVPSNEVYRKLEALLREKGERHYYIGTVEGSPTIADLLEQIGKEPSCGTIVLAPLMIVAGDHAVHDLAGDGEDSWKSIFRGRGYEVRVVSGGIGEWEEVQELFVKHAREAKALTPAES